MLLPLVSMALTEKQKMLDRLLVSGDMEWLRFRWDSAIMNAIQQRWSRCEVEACGQLPKMGMMARKTEK
jgi:hypothetical protein